MENDKKDLKEAKDDLEKAKTELKSNPTNQRLLDTVTTYEDSVLFITKQCNQHRTKIQSIESQLESFDLQRLSVQKPHSSTVNSLGSDFQTLQISSPFSSPFQINVEIPIILRLWETGSYDALDDQLWRHVTLPIPSDDILSDLGSLVKKEFDWAISQSVFKSLKFYYFPNPASYGERVKIDSVSHYYTFFAAARINRVIDLWVYMEPVDSDADNKSPFKGPPPRINTKLITDREQRISTPEPHSSSSLSPDNDSQSNSPLTRNRTQQRDFRNHLDTRDKKLCVVTSHEIYSELDAGHLISYSDNLYTVPTSFLLERIKILQKGINSENRQDEKENQNNKELIECINRCISENTFEDQTKTPLHHNKCIPFTNWYYPEYGVLVRKKINSLMDSGNAWFECSSDGSVILFKLSDMALKDETCNHLRSYDGKPIRQPTEDEAKKRWPPPLIFNIHRNILAPYYRSLSEKKKSPTSSKSNLESEKEKERNIENIENETKKDQKDDTNDDTNNKKKDKGKGKEKGKGKGKGGKNGRIQ